MMPKQKPGRSKQDYGTPQALIDAVEKRWGKLGLDLAANKDGSNAKAPLWLWNTLQMDWASWGTLCWLNPPFADIAPWAAKCAVESRRGAKIIMLVPASIGSEWFARYVEGNAGIVALRPRLVFEGCKDPYPKDCMLVLWGIRSHSVQSRDSLPALSTWRWKL